MRMVRQFTYATHRMDTGRLAKEGPVPPIGKRGSLSKPPVIGAYVKVILETPQLEVNMLFSGVVVLHSSNVHIMFLYVCLGSTLIYL